MKTKTTKRTKTARARVATKITKSRKAKSGRGGVDWVAAGKKAAETRKRNLAQAAAAALTKTRRPRKAQTHDLSAGTTSPSVPSPDVAPKG